MHPLFNLALGLTLVALVAQPSSLQAKPRKDSRTISNTTGWMPAAGELNVDLGFDQEKRPTGGASVGLGDIGEFGLQLQHERGVCDPCDNPSKDKLDMNVSTAFFKMGTPEGMGHSYAPAVALVFRKAMLRQAQVFTDSERVISKSAHKTRSAMLTAMASKRIGPTALHLGAELLVLEGDAIHGDFGVSDPVIRPALGLQWTPRQYPLSTFLVDLRWVSTVAPDPDASAEFEWSTGMIAAWGVRYQALEWASVDLNVRRQSGEGLGEALVTLGVRGSFDLKSNKRPSNKRAK